MTTYLLDADVLIALTIREHEHHDRAATWARGIKSFALCPVIEGALVRFVVRMGEAPASALAILRGVRERAGMEFWSDDVSYADIDLSGVRGHRQVTDAYLVGLAQVHRGGLVATFDEGLHAFAPRRSCLLPA